MCPIVQLPAYSKDFIPKKYPKILQNRTNSFERKTRSINNNNINNIGKKHTMNLLLIPKTGPKVKKEIQTFGRRVVF